MKSKYSKKIYAFIQARQTSTRLPNKVFLKLNKISVLENIKKRLSLSKIITKIIFLIPSNKNNSFLKKFLIKKKYLHYCGSELNVLKRYYDASNKFKPDIIVRITADCPLIDYSLIDIMLQNFLKYKKTDYLSNTIKRTYPDGLDVEIFTRKALNKTFFNTKKKYDCEHVTPYMKRNLVCKNYSNKKDYSKYRWTLDTIRDYKKIRKMFEDHGVKINYNWKKILNYENS